MNQLCESNTTFIARANGGFQKLGATAAAQAACLAPEVRKKPEGLCPSLRVKPAVFPVLEAEYSPLVSQGFILIS